MNGRCSDDREKSADTRRSIRPGLPALSYRLGVQSDFLRRMISRLHQPTVPDGPDLARLTVRDAGDPAIAVLDAWAAVADVLSFYQERIVNEGYLRTATERRSVLELARSIGYELAPGVAAFAYLAFEVDDSPGSPKIVTVPAGTQVQSVPQSGDEMPQTFETEDTLVAREAWNALRPVTHEPQRLDHSSVSLLLEGVHTGLQPGDAILIVGKEREAQPGSENWDLRIVREVTPLPADGVTQITWHESLGHELPGVMPASEPRVYVMRQRAGLFGHNAPDWTAMAGTTQAEYARKHGVKPEGEWPGFTLDPLGSRIDLDAVYPKILEGSWIALAAPDYVELYRAKKAFFDSRTDFTLTAKTTGIKLDTNENLHKFGLRETVVYAQSEALALAGQPIQSPVFGGTIVLDGRVEGLGRGHQMIVSGRRLKQVSVAGRSRVVRRGAWESIRRKGDLIFTTEGSLRRRLQEQETLTILAPPIPLADGFIRWRLRRQDGTEGYVDAQRGDLLPEQGGEPEEWVAEPVVVKATEPGSGETVLHFERELEWVYDRPTVVIAGNVVGATHGETVIEVLGSGDGSVPNQHFSLRRKPLTYTSAPSAGGTQSTLRITVGGISWRETPSFRGLSGQSECFAIRLSDDAPAGIVFGDGRNGARLQTGVENIEARYRVGLGLGAEVPASSLTLLKTRPLGIRSVTNHLSATGAADSEALAEARINAPLTVTAMGRIVSLRDYEDFARSFAGVGKASASLLWDGKRRLVHVTVTSSSGRPLSRSVPLLRNLAQAIKEAGDGQQAFQVEDCERVMFDVAVRVYIGPDADASLAAAIRRTMMEAFGFGSRPLGQAVTAAEIMTVISAISGVIALDLEQLALTGGQAGDSNLSPPAFLPSRAAVWNESKRVAEPAQLLLLNPSGLTITMLEGAK